MPIISIQYFQQYRRLIVFLWWQLLWHMIEVVLIAR